MRRTWRACFCEPFFTLAVLTVLTTAVAHKLEFQIEPSDTIVQSGHSAVLDCVPVSSQFTLNVLNVQWLDQDGQIINFLADQARSQLMNGSLYIGNVTEEQGLTGDYQCMVSMPNNAGSVVSRKAKLSLASLSGFLQEPHDITVYPGQRAHFACLVQASPQPRIKWLKDERPLQLDPLRMVILPSGSLEIDEVRDSDIGSYRCNASGLNTYRLSNKGTLIVNGDIEQGSSLMPPSFVASPRSQVVVEGQTATLDCAANGNPNPIITWLKDGRSIDMADLDSRFSIVASTSTLRITNIREEDAGTYQCRAENRADSFDASAEVKVQVPPRFLKKPHKKEEYVNSDVELECSVYGKPPPKVHWLKNGEMITLSEYYQLVNGHNLKIMGLMVDDTGMFQCVASNPAGNIQAAALLTVLDLAQKPKRKRKKKPALSSSISLLTQLKAEPSTDSSELPTPLGMVEFGHLAPHEVLFGGGNSKNERGGKPSKSYDPHKIFTSLQPSETQEFRFDDLGVIKPAFTQNYPNRSNPFIADLPSKIENAGLPGPPRNLSAPMVNARFVVLSWMAPLTHDDIITYSVFYRQENSKRERVQNATRYHLEEINIGGLQPDRVYHFRVAAYTSKGYGAISQPLTIKTQSEEHVPSSPQQFTAYPISSRTIRCTWKPPESPNGSILRYRVYYMETMSSLEHNIETNKLEYDINSLSIYTEYNIWVVAINHNGAGAATQEIAVRTFGDAPTEPPDNVTIEAVSSSSVMVRWEPPPEDGQNGPITGYKVRYKKSGSGRKADTLSTPGNKRDLLLENLERGSLYQIKLWALNNNGTGPPTEWYEIETYENDLDESKVPDVPGPLKVRPSDNKIYVSWTPPANQNIKIRNYILGWGKGVPDLYTDKVDERARSYEIDRLESNSEYVISLRASNEKGPGQPVYATVRTRDEPPPEPQVPLIPPVGLKAQVISPNSVILTWIDTTLSKSQYIRDNRYYTVKYKAESSVRARFLNVSDLHTMISDLKPNTLYEFSVKLIKGRRESDYSMVVTNRTGHENALNSPPRNFSARAVKEDSQLVELSWQPPKQSIGQVTGYVIMYTTEKDKIDRDWMAEAVKGDKQTLTLSDLQTSTTYYFKIKARNERGYGPFSPIISYKTGSNYIYLEHVHSSDSLDVKSIFSDTMLLYIVIGGTIIAVGTITAVVVFLCCRKKETVGSPDRSKKGYQKGNQSIKPPDLWIHHDQMELKEKSHSNNDGASSSGAMTLPRSVGGNDYDNNDHGTHHTNSLDKRAYAPSYGSSDDKGKRFPKSKPISLPVDCKPPREPIATATPINTSTLSQTSSDSTPSSRPPYPRTQYTISRAHVTLDQNPAAENPYASHGTHVGYDSGPNSTSGYVSAGPPAVAHVPPASAYAPGMSVLAESQGGKRVQGPQGHPLKSFTVPAPPPISAPGTPQPKHVVSPHPQFTVRANASPYKKAPSSGSSTLTSTPPSRISSANPPPHTAEEVQRLQPSHSTEELNQEMANLEGLMMTLNAITANEFEC